MYNIFGSQLSSDLDIMSVINQPLNNEDSKNKISSLEASFNSYGKNVDVNLCILKDGVIDWVYKGTPDECNNMVLDTFNLHYQKFPSFIEKRVGRDVRLKISRSLRIILSMISRTEFRKEVKLALKSQDDKKMFDCLDSIDLSSILDLGSKNFDHRYFVRKAAFQMAQTYALINGAEIYTKSDMAHYSGCFDELIYGDITYKFRGIQHSYENQVYDYCWKEQEKESKSD